MKKWIPCLLLIACSGAQTKEDVNDTAAIDIQSQGDVALFINEVLAKSDTTEDWLELYNPQDEELDISGFQLQDSAQIPWSIPEGTVIDAQGFLIIWADDAAEEGLHAPFKLSKEGEEVSLLSAEGDSIDTVLFPDLAPEESYARIEDGSIDWEIREESTPGESNQL